MKSILYENKFKLGLILITGFILLWSLWADELIRYDSLDSYIKSHTKLDTTSKVLTYDDNYALCISIKNEVIYDSKILEKTKKGKWKVLKGGWDYKFRPYYIFGKEVFDSCTVDTYYIKNSNIMIFNLYQFDNSAELNKQDNINVNFIKIEEISDFQNSFFYPCEFINGNNMRYNYTAVIKDFNSEQYKLYINGYIYPYSSWTKLF